MHAHIKVTSWSTSADSSEVIVAHEFMSDLLGEVKTVFVSKSQASISAIVYEKSKIIFNETIEIKNSDYEGNFENPYIVAVNNERDALIERVKSIMKDVALARQVVHGEQEVFRNMLDNAFKAFPGLSQDKGAALILEALKAKRKRSAWDAA